MESLGIDEYEIDAWLYELGSKPIKRIAHEDYSEPYEMNMGHVFELENGQFALVTEEGCSCYDPAQAVIELFPTQVKALEQLKNWKRENYENGG